MLSAPVVGLGLDTAREAARRAARRSPQHGFVVADLWEEWPVKSAVADLVLSIFEPKNFAETARVLTPGGLACGDVSRPNSSRRAQIKPRSGRADRDLNA